ACAPASEPASSVGSVVTEPHPARASEAPSATLASAMRVAPQKGQRASRSRTCRAQDRHATKRSDMVRAFETQPSAPSRWRLRGRYTEDMSETLARIEAALQTVQSTLDALTARGENETAFRIAKAQFSASLRSSWPANLAPLVALLDELVKPGSRQIDDAEKAALARACSALRAALEG